MNFAPGDDLRAFHAAIEKIVEGHLSVSLTGLTRSAYANEVDRLLAQGGYFDCVDIEGVGRIGAALMLMELSLLPDCVEAAASTLVAPCVCPDLPRPYAMMFDHPALPARYLPMARTVIQVGADSVQVAVLDTADTRPTTSLFAYPFGVLTRPQALDWRPVAECDAEQVRNAWGLGVASELVGCLAAGLRSVVEHVQARRQFGRPIGAFQAVQHRLAECATAIESARWLALRAAGTALPLDIAVAVAQTQHIATRVTYDLHQFMGAMGLTLEHPLHRWTYRAKWLRSELGGADRHFADVARAAWGAAENEEITT